LQIDILVDLMGHTANNHMAVLAYGPAPIQVNYLGFPGSIGTDCVDYAIVDPVVAPPDVARNFTESLVYLPDCYQPNDPARKISDRTPSRRECKLPDESFVFCSFNNNLKFTPAVFDVWMRLLAQLPGAVFWLYVDNKVAISNLRKEAEARGIDPNRLVFAAKLPLADHLARHRLADLFLDTLPYGGHTTASDALWAGLPLVTCLGRSFPSRVAGSLLRAVGLPELVTENLEAYEKLALALAAEPQRLSEIRRRLAQNRLSAPLFDGERYRLHIEAAYSEMFEFWRRGEKPRPIKVEPIPG
jgi:predicted O-linked N-acetylglucosamine transferase (SPINDLY family)